MVAYELTSGCIRCLINADQSVTELKHIVAKVSSLVPICGEAAKRLTEGR